MRKLFFITLVLLASCTVKKKRDTVYSPPETEQDTAVAPKKFLYVDTAEEVSEAPKVVYEDSAATVTVNPPAENNTYTEPASQDTIEVDTTVYRWELAVAPDSVKEWKNMQSFAYVKHLDSLLEAAKNKKKQEKKTPVHESNDSGGGTWLDGLLGSGGLKIFLWVLAGAFVLFIIYKLFITEGAFRRKPKADKTASSEVEEEVITPESDMDRLIREALQQSNYRLATRYHYLQTLHLLAEKNYVQLAADKTNYNYVHEIKDFGKQNGFAALTRNYEYVWYGEFAIDELVYHRLKTAFQSFNATL